MFLPPAKNIGDFQGHVPLAKPNFRGFRGMKTCFDIILGHILGPQKVFVPPKHLFWAPMVILGSFADI